MVLVGGKGGEGVGIVEGVEIVAWVVGGGDWLRAWVVVVWDVGAGIGRVWEFGVVWVVVEADERVEVGVN